jgi:hypothetical protein
MNRSPSPRPAEHPTSERWRTYYNAASAKRRAHGPQRSITRAHQLWRRRERMLLAGSLLAMGLLVTVSYVVLSQ